MTATAHALTTTTPALFQSSGGLIRGKLKVDLGRLELTSTGVVFYQRNKLFYLFGLLGALLAARTTGKRALEIPLGAVTGLARSKYGFNKKVVDVTLADGAVHRLTIDKFDDFMTRLREELGRTGRVESSGDERWTVRR